MLARSIVSQILVNESLTRGLCDPESRILVEWLVEQAETLAVRFAESEFATALDVLCIRAKAIARFVWLWCHQRRPGAAIQLAAAERFAWPLPCDPRLDPCDLMTAIVAWETQAALHA
jgi:hypothetical protein